MTKQETTSTCWKEHAHWMRNKAELQSKMGLQTEILTKFLWLSEIWTLSKEVPFLQGPTPSQGSNLEIPPSSSSLFSYYIGRGSSSLPLLKLTGEVMEGYLKVLWEEKVFGFFCSYTRNSYHPNVISGPFLFHSELGSISVSMWEGAFFSRISGGFIL